MIVKLIVLILLAWFCYQIYLAIQEKKKQKPPRIKSQDMVSCDKCGIHIPVSEALKKGDKYFCNHHLPKTD